MNFGIQCNLKMKDFRRSRLNMEYQKSPKLPLDLRMGITIILFIKACTIKQLF